MLREAGLYIHWPFCQSKCPYCDFNSHVVDRFDGEVWADAYERELRRIARDTPDLRLRSIYFGGGTPSLMPPSVVERVISTAQACWSLNNDVEITLEANPTTVETQRFLGYRSAGVNRISVGVQSLNNDDLKRLGRLHTADEAKAALAIAHHTFDRVSFDLIYGRQWQSLDDWRSELSDALKLASGHLSLYQLTVEPGTVFSRRFEVGQLKGLPEEDLGADLYEATQSLCELSGFSAYEISNHAQLDQEGRHNMVYWEGLEYLGVGPGAHGRIVIDGHWQAIEHVAQPTEWLDAAMSGGTSSRRNSISDADRQVEKLMMGLRINRGIALDAVDLLPLTRLSDLIDLGFVEKKQNRISLTHRGRPVLNEVLRQLLIH